MLLSMKGDYLGKMMQERKCSHMKISRNRRRRNPNKIKDTEYLFRLKIWYLWQRILDIKRHC
jgi:hypothetical protein